MKRNTPSTDDDEKEYNNSDLNATDLVNYDSNPFHLDLNKVPRTPIAGVTPEYVRVRVVLRDKDMRFFADPTNSVYGIAYGNPTDARDWICQDPDPAKAISRTGRGKSVLTFYVERQNINNETQVNFMLTGDSATFGANGGETPIMIDPHIRNDG